MAPGIDEFGLDRRQLSRLVRLVQANPFERSNRQLAEREELWFKDDTTKLRSDTLREDRLEPTKHGDGSGEDPDRGSEAVGEPAQIRRLSEHDRVRHSLEQRGNRIDQQHPVPAAENRSAKEYRRYEDGKHHKDFDQILHVTEEEPGRRQKDRQPRGQYD